MNDRIAKEKLNIFLLIDASTSMRGKRIAQVNDAIKDIRDYLCELILAADSDDILSVMRQIDISSDEKSSEPKVDTVSQTECAPDWK